MLHHIRIWLMIAVLGLVLPLAGSPLCYCLCAHTLVLAGSHGCACDAELPEPADAGCCQSHDPAPTMPDCMVSLRVLPDALLQADLALPTPVTSDLPPPVFVAPNPPLVLQIADPELHERGPPLGGPPIYLRNRSLLL